ncbi:MAG: glycine cleavage system protein GcvH [Myxococcota bacterium]|nr:glycine cleavage system protein GcvH [Myxococcota bacterium]
MSVPAELQYTKDHEWVRIEGDEAVVGITTHAQDQLGDVVFVELPEVGASFEAGDTFGTVESVKAVSDLYAPLTGEITAVNDALEDAPETVNSAPYGDGWMIKVKFSGDAGHLLSADDYQKLIEG